MYMVQGDSFVIQVREGEPHARSRVGNKVNLSPMKLFNRFRKILMRFFFTIPIRTPSVPTRGRGEHLEPPKTSCSSYHYSPNSHYTEAIADCIEFLNKSSQDTALNGWKSDALD